MIPIILNDLKENPENAKKYPLTYNDVERIVQLYNKWWPSTSERTLTFTIKQKRMLKKILGAD